MDGGAPAGLIGRWWRELVVVGVAVLGAVVLVGGALLAVSGRDVDVVLGAVKDPAVAAAEVSEPEATGVGAPIAAADGDGPGVGRKRASPTGRALLDPGGRPYGSPVPFNASIRVPGDLVWVLVIGTDARPDEEMLHARADSIHLIGANPRTGQATIIGVPRDAWIDIPGHGAQKINQATVIGGPELLAKAVHTYLGLPVQWWVTAGFAAFERIVDTAGGIDIEVTEKMDDHASGARFAPGYHHMDGAQALAFSRDRHDYADGDFSRSANHGKVVLAALQKLRSEVSDEAGLRRWISWAFLHLDTNDVSSDDAVGLMAVARRTEPSLATNLVLPGRAGTARGQSVVFLDADAVARIADDVRPDAAIGAEGRDRTAPSTTTTAGTGWTSPSTSAPPVSSSVTSPSSSTTTSTSTTSTTRAPTTAPTSG